MDTPVLHHIGVGVQNEKPLFQLLQQQMGFKITADRHTDFDSKWILQKDKIIFVCTKLKTGLDDKPPADSLSVPILPPLISLPEFSNSWYDFPSNEGSHLTHQYLPIGSVYELVFEVSCVDDLIERARVLGARIIRPVSVVKDQHGSVTYGTFISPVGNVHHTLINRDLYHGPFLPTFVVKCNDDAIHPSPIGPLTVDHVTICVPRGKTAETITWYRECFGMARLLVNRNESEEEGLLLSNIGMKLAAMEYWKCAESGIQLGHDDRSLKIVLAESLSNDPNQVSTFLMNHGGPGIQHIGLLTDDLIVCSRHLQNVNVPCLQPPNAYYDEIEKRLEIEECGQCVKQLEASGILLDSEADGIQEDGDPGSPRFLMQIFSKPIFGNETFFLEFLQREGATGFGAGNITALWKAVHQYLSSKGALSTNK